jgi:glutamyl-tRNA synthetase
MNFLALLGWSYDDKTTVMSRDELIERFSLERVQPSPATFDYKKLDWLNGVYLRNLSEDEYAHELLLWLGEHGYAWDAELVGRTVPLVQEKIARLGEYPAYAGFLFHDVDPDPSLLDPEVLRKACDVLETVSDWTAQAIETELRALAEGLDLKPAKAFEPIRVAATGSKISPGLFESLELLGREETLRRLRRAADAAV